MNKPELRLTIVRGDVKINFAWIERYTKDMIWIRFDTDQKYPKVVCAGCSGGYDDPYLMFDLENEELPKKAKKIWTEVRFPCINKEWLEWHMVVRGCRYGAELILIKEPTRREVYRLKRVKISERGKR